MQLQHKDTPLHLRVPPHKHMGLRLTRKLQLKAFTRVLAVGDKLEPHAAGSAVYAGAEHFRAAKGAQQASRAIAAVVDLGGTRSTYWKTYFVCYFRDQVTREREQGRFL